ncbi:MAG TPA: DUF4262 domain-containing protein [Terracidiphilus sp.]|nr:DUF4262 domain-containing protein [Terracidiphilus sp.]
MPDHAKNYDTPRIRQLRATDLHPTDENNIRRIEEYGCSVISVGRDCNDDLSWTYTIGVYDTCDKPDLITVGLKFGVAQACLNEAVKRQREGVNLTQERQAELIGNVDCEFRPVDPKWVRHLMNWANWYYNRTDYPVLQAVYPDLENRFPEDEGFDSRFAQPLMQLNAPFTQVEQEFWESVDRSDKSANFSDWRFPDPPHTGVYLSKAVLEGKEAITYVSHDADDGAWQFLGDSMTESGGALSCFHHPIDSDPSLKELADLPLGWWAERDALGDSWRRYEHEPEAANS